jgi:hypothetical protein
LVEGRKSLPALLLLKNMKHARTHGPDPNHNRPIPTPFLSQQQSAKQKAVLDLLRELRQQGLGAGATPALRALRDPVALAHAPAPFALEGLLVLPSPTGKGACVHGMAWFSFDGFVQQAAVELFAKVDSSTHLSLPPQHTHTQSPDAAAVASTKPAELTARVGEAWRKAERYHAKALAEMMGLRADALKQSPHRDVPAAQVCVCVCVCVRERERDKYGLVLGRGKLVRLTPSLPSLLPLFAYPHIHPTNGRTHRPRPCSAWQRGW